MKRSQWYGWPKKRALYSQGEGPGGECVCPECGAKKPHEAGTPCTDVPCPKCGTKMVREGAIINKAAYSRSRCMMCDNPPQIDARWADGRGRAWFCIPHFLEWTQKEPREIVQAWFIKDGQAPKTLKDHPGARLGTEPAKIANRARELAHGG